MQPAPVDLDDPYEVLTTLADLPVRTRHGHLDLVLLTASHDHLSTRIVLVDDIPVSTSGADRARGLRKLWTRVRDLDGTTAAAVGVCRDGTLAIGGDELAWHDALRATAALAGVECIGVYLVTPHGALTVRPLAA